MEYGYFLLLLLIGLFLSVIVNCDDHNQITEQLHELAGKMEKIETLLYKVLIATESIQNDADGTCLPAEYFEKTKECINLGDIMCTSIDLLANKAVCYECVSCSDNTVVPCKHYGKLTQPLLVPDIQVKISNMSINTSILDFKIEKIEKEDFIVEVSGCKKCIWSQYNYTYIFKQSRVQAYAERPLRCECDDVEYKELYCRAWDTPSCYVRKADCSWNATALNCNVSKCGDDETYVDIIISGLKKAKCQHWEKISGCNVSVTFDDKNLDIIHNKKHLEWTENLMINVRCPRDNPDPCNAPFPKICNESFSIEDCTIITPPVPSEPTSASVPKENESDNNNEDDDDNKKGTPTTLLIVIIIILLLLLLLYVGYQNHQKISSCINGTEGAAGPPPSNRRGRMKGKYAPLPRSMEETLPRHDD